MNNLQLLQTRMHGHHHHSYCKLFAEHTSLAWTPDDMNIPNCSVAERMTIIPETIITVWFLGPQHSSGGGHPGGGGGDFFAF
jgi:hypothetical protein